MKIGKSIDIHHAWLLWVPWASFALGFAMNAAVMAANRGQMPVLIPSGNCGLIDPDDLIHTCMVSATHLKFLADWIVVNHVGIFSPGDFFEIATDLMVGPFFGAWFMGQVNLMRKTKS